MNEWWSNLSGLTQFFFGLACFFSVFFLWQVIAAFIGMAGDDADFGGDGGDADLGGFDAPDNIDHHDLIESSQAFKILSLRSVITFFTMFSWGSALYLSTGMAPAKAIGISLIWGLGGMFAVALVFWAMMKLAETGTKDVMTCNGNQATVYLDIPADGFGEIKTLISGAYEHVRAKSESGEALPSGTEVRVVKVYTQTLVGVEKI